MLTSAPPAPLDLSATYRVMLTIRRLVERCQELRARDEIAGSTKTPAPLDHAALQRAVEGSGRVVVVHEVNETGGFGAEVAACISSHCFDSLDAPVLRVGAPDVRMPSAPSLQAALVPDEGRVVQAARGLVREGA